MTNGLFTWLYTRNPGPRIAAIDALRGLAICGMILVNHPPPGGTAYSPLVHSAWDGWTLADTIFPAFLFVVGISIALSLSKSGAGKDHDPAGPYGKILRRGLLLALISVVLVNFPYYELGTLKLTGTLWRIGLCSVLASLAFLHLRWRAQAVLLAVVLIIHWVLLQTVGPGAYLAFDQAILGSHYRGDHPDGYDSTGLATTLGAFASTLCGTLAGRWLWAQADPLRRAAGLLAAGFAAGIAGTVLGLVQPVNKILWSSSFVVLMAGLSMLALGAMFALQTRSGGLRLLRPLEIAGVNALAVFVGARLLQILMVYGRVRDPAGEPAKLGVALYERLLSSWIAGEAGSLLYALAFLGLCYTGVYLLYRMRIFIRL